MSDTGSEVDEDILLFPITDIDSQLNISHSDEHETSGSDADEECSIKKPKPEMPLRERRIKRAYSIAKPININIKPLVVSQSPGSHRMRWISAIRKAKAAQDPWASFHINSMETEVCTRHQYNALKKTWKSDEVLVKMETKVRVQGGGGGEGD